MELRPLPGRVGGYQEFSPPRELAPFVRCFWRYRSGDVDDGTRHRVIPHGGVSLCVQRDLADGHAEGLFMGPVARVRFFRPGPGLVMEAVELRPEWCRAVLGVAPEDHTDALTPWGELASLPGPAAGLGGEAEQGGALPALARWVARRCEEARADASTRLAHAALRYLADLPSAPVRGAARHLGVSVRHLRRLVTGVVGVGPKYAHRVARLHRVVAAADAYETPPWAALAAGAGYCDQAHLIQDVRGLAGVTPAVLHAERRGQPVPFFQSTADRPA